MNKPNLLRWSAPLGCAALLCCAASVDAAPPSANLDQARNGGSASPTSPVNFQNGNAGASNSHYLEGQSIPYRMVFDNLSLGTHTVRIEWDIRSKSKNAIDYITHFNRLQPHAPPHRAEVVDPLAGLLGTFGPPKTFLIPAPSSAGSNVLGQPTASCKALPLGEQSFTIYNGTITNARYVSQGSLTAAQSSTRIAVTFTASSPRVVLAWGGHIASRLDWGAGNSASSISGSPYHTRLIDLDGSGGNQDRSLTAAAVVIPSTCDIVVGPAPVCGGSTNTYAATASAVNPTFKWSISGSGTIIGSTAGSSVSVTAGTSGNFTLTATVSTSTASSTCSKTVTVCPLPACSIVGSGQVCPTSSNPYSGPSGLQTYSWSISGNGTITGTANGPSINVQAGAVCGGSYLLKLTVRDFDGCTSTCQKTVLANDTTPPVIAGPADQQLQCGASSDPSGAGTATATDNCAAPVTIAFTDAPAAAGCTGVAGIDRTWKATDACGNIATAVQHLTFVDTTPPVIACPADQQLECGASSDPSGASTATATDNCAAPVTVTFTDAPAAAGCTGVAGIDRTWKATDACGNSSTAVQHLTFVDTTPPVIACPPDDQLKCGAPSDPSGAGTATATDNCGAPVAVSFTDAASVAGCTGGAGIERTWKATDACGNVATAVQRITIVDTLPPLIACPADQQLQCGASSDPSGAGTATATDNCGGPVNVTFTDAPAAAGCTGVAGIERTWKATDACGNSSTAVQHLTFVDTTPPVIACPADQQLECGASSDPSGAGTATATDNCGAPVTVTFTDAPAAAGCTGIAGIDRTWKATDACGNSSTAVQHLTVVDTTPPVIVCPADRQLQCGVSTGPADTGTATATDNCAVGATLTFSDAATAPGCAGVAGIDRTWRATDDCGNVATAVQHLTFVDTTPPVVACPPDRLLQGGDSTDPSYTGSMTATDNCGASVTITRSDAPAGGCGGRNLDRTWKAADPCGNMTTCVQHLTFVDTPPPTASTGGAVCAGQTLQLNATPVPGGIFGWSGPGGFSSTLQNPSVANVQPSQSGQYCVTVTLYGCTSTPSCTNATVRSLPSVTASTGGGVCIGQTLQLNATPVAGGSFSWTGPGGFTSTLQNPSIPNAQPAHSGQYCVTVTLNGCTSPPSCTKAAVNAPPGCTITGPASLPDGTTDLLCGPSGNLGYSWSTGATTRCITVGPGSYSLQITDLATGCQSAPCSFTINRIPCACVTGYPDKSNPPRSSVQFSEQHILQAMAPTSCPSTDSLLKLWYNDEAAILLGVKGVIVKTSSGTVTTDYPVTPNPVSPACVWQPQAGTTTLTGDQAGTDASARPLFPALFVTDITDDLGNRSGDWQQGASVAYPPTKICGRWKAVVRTLDKTVSPAKVTITLDSDQVKNHWNLGSGSDSLAGGFGGLLDEGYGAEVAWNLNQLPLVPGRTYRLYFTLQDGDQTKSNGDAAHGCFTVHVPVTITTTAFGVTEQQSLIGQPGAGNGSEGFGDLPRVYELMQNYPNPFLAATTIRYALPERSEVSVRVFTILGQEVATLVNGTVNAGYHSFGWKAVDRFGNPLPPGVYMYRLQTRSLSNGAFRSMKKMVLFR